MKPLQAKLTISRPSGNGDEYVSLTVVDETSHCEAIQVRISLENFARALTGQGYIPCEMDFNDSGVIGMVAENRTLEVPYKRDIGLSPIRENMAIAKALKPYEIDGWKGDKGDMKNHHRLRRTAHGDFYSVTFRRHVEAKKQH